MIAVRTIETSHIHSGFYHLPQNINRRTGRSNSAHNLGASELFLCHFSRNLQWILQESVQKKNKQLHVSILG